MTGSQQLVFPRLVTGKSIIALPHTDLIVDCDILFGKELHLSHLE